MWLLLVLTSAYALTYWIFSHIPSGWLGQLIAFALYLWLTEDLHRCGYLRVPSWRASVLARFVQRYAPVRFSADSQARLQALARDGRQLMFAVAPHGPMSLSLAIGFAGHCGDMPRCISDNLDIVGHWSIRLIPFVRELASAFGFISSAREPVEDALKAERHLALIPCGMRSKMQTLIDEPAPPDAIVMHRERERFGFLSLAQRYGMLVVPVLAPEENELYTLYGTSLGCWPLTLAIGRYVILPRKPLTLRVGEPIDAAKFKGQIKRLEYVYYAALEELAAPTHRIVSRFL